MMNMHDTATFDVKEFEKEVIQRSRQQPVLVDFWAPWCGPCRTLGPLLEKLANEPSTGWRLAKVNVDEHQAAAQRYGVRGIPAVKLFVDGTVVDEFTGALPEHAIRKWLDEALPSRARKLLDEAEALMEKGDHESAEPLVREALEDEPNDAKAQLLLARLIVFTDPDRAEEVVERAGFAGPPYAQIGESVRTVARLLRLHASDDALPEGDEMPLYQEAVEALAQRDFDRALTQFISVIQRNRSYDDDGARKACVALFTLLGAQHPSVTAHRRSFDMSLY